MNRLTSAQNAGTDCTAKVLQNKTEYWGNSYTYDAWGNLLNKIITKCGAENLLLTADAHNWIHATSAPDYQYDAAGNMTYDATASLNYSFDQENRLTGSNGYSYTYDGDGNRVRKSNGNTAGDGTLYWAMTPGVVAETDLAGTLKSEYVFFDDERVARRDGVNGVGGVFYYFSDHLKTASVITDSAGVIKAESDYYPWGGELQFTNNDSNHYKFTGKERDETGLDDMGARYYSNSLGRFLAHDPIQTSGFEHMHDPQAWNGYAYARNNPLIYVDPDGMDYTLCGPNGKDCSNLTDNQFKDWLKANPNVSVSPSGQLTSNSSTGPGANIGSASYFNEKDVAAAAMLAHTGRVLSDPRTIAAWYGLSALGGLGLYGTGALEGGLTTLELSGGGELLTNQAAGQIIGWGTGQAGAEATKQLAQGLTKEAVKQMVKNGLTKATVQRLLFKYGAAIGAGGAKLANSQLQPRYQLMQKILELWPK